jgi:hypothetical protein
MLRKLRGSESPAPVPSYLYSPLVPPYFCAYIVFEISTKVNFCFINFDASSLPAFSPILRLFIWDIFADSAIMVKSVRLCRTEPAIFKADIIMSKIVNEAKIGHLRSGLLPLLPDIHCLHRRRFSAWPSRLSCSEDAAGRSACDRHSSTPSAFLTQAVLHSFSRLLLAVLQKTTTRPDSCTSANCPGVFYAF